MSQPKSIQKIIDRLLKNLGIETKIKENMAVILWPEIVGKRISQESNAQKVIDGILFVKVESSTWRAELLLHKEKIIEKINKRVGKPVIAEIRFI